MTSTKEHIFVIQPFDKSSDGLYELIRSAAAATGATVVRADMGMAVGPDVVLSIQQAIQAASLIIADITGANPNVMYEVGLAQAQNKPLIIVANNSRSIPFDLARVRVVIYDLTNADEFVDRLSKSISKAIRDPDAFRFARAVADREKHPYVFISYSHSDKEYLDRLIVHLKPLQKDGLVDLWVDTHLRAGDKWRKEIEKALNRANVAVLMVSADFLASDFVTENELPPLLKNAEEKGTRIVPVIVKPCRFTRDKNLRHFQSINDPKRSLALLPEGEKEALYDQIAAEVERSLQRS